MEKRETYKVKLPINPDIPILHPNLSSLAISDKSLDIGLICYTEVEVSIRWCTFNPESLLESRIPMVSDLFLYANELIDSELKGDSIYMRLINFRRFVIWSDINNNCGVLNSFFEARTALEEYVLYLKDRICLGSLHNNTAARYQYDVIIILVECYGYSNIDTGLNLIKKSNSSVNHTQPPDELEQAKLLLLSECVFKGLHKNIISKARYPFAIDVPSYLKYPNNQAWVFPSSKWVKHPSSSQITNTVYDYVNGRILSESDLDKKDHKADYKKWAIKTANKRIDSANTYESNHFLVTASIALSSFLVLFTANTGMNLQQIIELPWCRFYEVGEDTQEFRNIKYRAGDKEVSFFINSSFLSDFKKYIELRNFLVNRFGEPGFLFFRCSQKNSYKFEPITKNTIQSTVKWFAKLDPNIKQVTAKEWRAAKSDYLIKHNDVQTAAILLQSTEQTVIESYSRGSDTNNISEISAFLNRLSERIKVDVDKASEYLDNSIGGCTDFGNPVPEENPPIDPDCRQGEGCLYCDKYIVHSDEKDVKKLYSCKFCIEATSHLSGSIDQFELFFSDILLRIEAILSSISSLSDRHLALVERIKSEVFEDGDLDPYWEAKYEQLQNLGVV